MNDKFRGNVICKVCGVHTRQVKKIIKGREIWVCLECNAEQEEVKDERKNP